jgi:hypothetical protein
MALELAEFLDNQRHNRSLARQTDLNLLALAKLPPARTARPLHHGGSRLASVTAA